MWLVHIFAHWGQTNMAASNNFSLILATLAAVLMHDVSPNAIWAAPVQKSLTSFSALDTANCGSSDSSAC